MTAMELAEYATAGYIEGGEQIGGAMALAVVAAAFDLSGAHGQQGCGSVQLLDVTFLVHALPQGAVGRVKVEANDVALCR